MVDIGPHVDFIEAFSLDSNCNITSLVFCAKTLLSGVVEPCHQISPQQGATTPYNIVSVLRLT